MFNNLVKESFARRRALALACAVAGMVSLAAMRSQAATIVIDDFGGDTLSAEWNQSNVLAVAGNDAVVTFDTTTNDDRLTYRFTTTTNNAVQTTLLRDDYSLANDGDMLDITLTLQGDSASANLLAGLVLDSGTETPTARDNLLMLLLVGNGRIIAQQNVTQSNGTASGLVPIGTSATLRMQRMSATQVALLYSLDGVNFTQLGGAGFNYNVAGFNSLGVIGGSARTTPTNAAAIFDDLTLTSVPEPATSALAMVGIGLAVAAGARRRRFAASAHQRGPRT